MTSARRIYRLQLIIAGVGAASVLLGLTAAVRTVSFSAPSARTLISACTSFILPSITPASLAVLGLGILSFAALGLAARSALGQLRAQRCVVSGLRRVSTEVIAHDGVRIFDDPTPQAFCAGLLRPQVYISRAALDVLTPQQLQAVLAHERHHVRRRDPLRLLVARVLSDALFFLPVLRRLTERYGALAEVAADEAAIRRSGRDRAPLAGALLELGRVSPAVVGVVAERVDHLLGGRPRWKVPLALMAWAGLVGGALLAVALRVAELSGRASVNLPLLAAELCMVVMAAAPLVIGAGGILLARRGAVRRLTLSEHPKAAA